MTEEGAYNNKVDLSNDELSVIMACLDLAKKGYAEHFKKKLNGNVMSYRDERTLREIVGLHARLEKEYF